MGDGTCTSCHPPPLNYYLLCPPAECIHLQLPLCVYCLSVIYVGLKCIYFCTSLLFFNGAKGPGGWNSLCPLSPTLRGSWDCRAGLPPQTPASTAGEAAVTSWIQVWPWAGAAQRGLLEGHNHRQAILVTTVALFFCPAQACWCRVWVRGSTSVWHRPLKWVVGERSLPGVLLPGQGR